MIRKILITFILCLLVTGCMSETSSKLESHPVTLTKKEEPPEEFVPKEIKLVGIGDSLTKGVGDESEQGGYVGMVKEKLEQQDNIKEVSVANYGVRGHKTSNLQKMLKEEEVIASIKDADMILMTVGGNDIMNVVRNNIFTLDFEPFRKEQKNFEKRLIDIFSTIRKYNSSAHIVYVGLYNPFKYMLPELTEIDTVIDEWNIASQQMIKKDEKAVYVSVDHIFSTDSVEKLLYKDEFHPNESGYSLIANRVYDAINEIKLYRDTKVRKE
jgi:lysophospholipase L1-like esterase